MSASLNCNIEGKSFQQFLLAIIKKRFYHEKSINESSIIEQFYSGISIDENEKKNQIQSYEEIIAKAAENQWDGIALEDKLKRLTDIKPDHLKILVAVWNTERNKIYKHIVEDSRYNNTFDKLSWRVDIQAMSKNNPEINEPIAHLKLATTGSIASFEMNRSQVGDMIENLEKIQKKFEEVM